MALKSGHRARSPQLTMSKSPTPTSAGHVELPSSSSPPQPLTLDIPPPPPTPHPVCIPPPSMAAHLCRLKPVIQNRRTAIFVPRKKRALRIHIAEASGHPLFKSLRSWKKPLPNQAKSARTTSKSQQIRQPSNARLSYNSPANARLSYNFCTLPTTVRSDSDPAFALMNFEPFVFVFPPFCLIRPSVLSSN